MRHKERYIQIQTSRKKEKMHSKYHLPIVGQTPHSDPNMVKSLIPHTKRIWDPIVLMFIMFTVERKSLVKTDSGLQLDLFLAKLLLSVYRNSQKWITRLAPRSKL